MDKKYKDMVMHFASCDLYKYSDIGEPYRIEFIDPLIKEKDITIEQFNEDLKMANKELRKGLRELEKKYCFGCNHFYDGCICGFEISADEDETYEEIKEKRKSVCERDKNVSEKRIEHVRDIF